MGEPREDIRSWVRDTILFPNEAQEGPKGMAHLAESMNSSPDGGCLYLARTWRTWLVLW